MRIILCFLVWLFVSCGVGLWVVKHKTSRKGGESCTYTWNAEVVLLRLDSDDEC